MKEQPLPFKQNPTRQIEIFFCLIVGTTWASEFIINNENIEELNKMELLLNTAETTHNITNIIFTIMNCLTVIPEIKLFAHATQPNLYSSAT